jgi:hypothetical protein
MRENIAEGTRRCIRVGLARTASAAAVALFCKTHDTLDRLNKLVWQRLQNVVVSSMLSSAAGRWCSDRRLK